MSTQEYRRKLTREFIQKVVDEKRFDASADLKEMIRIAKEIRYNNIAKTVEI